MSLDVKDDRPPLDRALRDRVLEQLGLPGPPRPDLEGLRALYRAWCAGVPFDNVRKLIALGAGNGRALPGIEPGEFLETWLEHGTGGTCWPTSNALHALARSVGFDAVRITAHMRDLGLLNHGSVRVRIGDGGAGAIGDVPAGGCGAEGGTGPADPDWLIDSSMLTDEPLPLGPGVFLRDDPVLPAEVEAEAGTHVVWCHTPPSSSHFPCRLVPGAVGHDDYVAAYERSRERSPFNERLYARRNRPGELIVLVGNTRFAKTAGGVERHDLPLDELAGSLRSDIGLSGAIVEEWIGSGAAEASFRPPTGPKPPGDDRKPPSQRVAA